MIYSWMATSSLQHGCLVACMQHRMTRIYTRAGPTSRASWAARTPARVLAAALAGVEGVAVAEELLPYVVCAVVLQPYASAKLVRLCDRLSLQVWDRTRCDRTKAMWGAWSPSAGKRVLRSCEQIDSSVCLCSAVVGFCRAHNLF